MVNEQPGPAPVITPDRWLHAFLDDPGRPRRPGGRTTGLRLAAFSIRGEAAGAEESHAPDWSDVERRATFGPPLDVAPPYERLCRHLRVTARTARRYLAELVSLGWLQGLAPATAQDPGRYRLAVPAFALERYPWATDPAPRCEHSACTWRPRCYQADEPVRTKR